MGVQQCVGLVPTVKLDTFQQSGVSSSCITTAAVVLQGTTWSNYTSSLQQEDGSPNNLHLFHNYLCVLKYDQVSIVCSVTCVRQLL